MRIILVVSIFMLVPSCGPIKVQREFSSLQAESHERVGAKPAWQSVQLHAFDQEIATRLLQGISLQDAVEIALRNNAQLQTQLEDLGIAKSAMVQAGLFRNPHIESTFRIPTDGQRTEIETELVFTLSDLWQVPIKKQIAQDELEIKSLDLLHTILETTAQAKHAYIGCIHAQEMLAVTKDIAKKVQDLRDRIYYRQQFGYSSDLDKYFADVKVGEWKNHVRHMQAMVNTSYINLRRVLGIEVSSEPVLLKNKLLEYVIQLPGVPLLKNYALETHPEIQIARLKIIQAKHTISLERSKIIDHATIGITHKRDFERPVKGAGPLFGIDIPLFDTNYGAIERAKYELTQAKKAITAQSTLISQELQSAYEAYQAWYDQIKIIEHTMIPPSERAIEYATKYFNSMQLNMLVLLESQISLYEVKKELLDTIYHAAQARVKVEQLVGSTVDRIKNSRDHHD